MYKIESVMKMVKLMKDMRSRLESGDINNVKMCISNGNRKIGKVMNVSLPPVIACGNCKACKLYCYDVKACLQYPETVINARMRNYVICCADRRRYFDEIDSRMARRRTNKYFRWHVAGDILDADYFAEMVENAIRHPDFIIWTYTKMYSIVNEWISANGPLPSNFHVMFSEWDGMEMDNPYNMPVFTCKLKAGNKNRSAESFLTMHKCPGNCDICKACGRGCIAGEDTYADEH